MDRHAHTDHAATSSPTGLPVPRRSRITTAQRITARHLDATTRCYPKRTVCHLKWRIISFLAIVPITGVISTFHYHTSCLPFIIRRKQQLSIKLTTRTAVPVYDMLKSVFSTVVPGSQSVTYDPVVTGSLQASTCWICGQSCTIAVHDDGDSGTPRLHGDNGNANIDNSDKATAIATCSSNSSNGMDDEGHCESDHAHLTCIDRHIRAQLHDISGVTDIHAVPYLTAAVFRAQPHQALSLPTSFRAFLSSMLCTDSAVMPARLMVTSEERLRCAKCGRALAVTCDRVHPVRVLVQDRVLAVLMALGTLSMMVLAGACVALIRGAMAAGGNAVVGADALAWLRMGMTDGAWAAVMLGVFSALYVCTVTGVLWHSNGYYKVVAVQECGEYVVEDDMEEGDGDTDGHGKAAVDAADDEDTEVTAEIVRETSQLMSSL